jgi:hypothetical protein
MLKRLIAKMNLTAGHLRLGFALISLFVLALGGSAGSRWT